MTDYRILATATVADYLASHPDLAARLGGTSADWQVRDVADGNLNAVYLIDGPAGGLCLKQALPYVRVAGESWPIDVQRITFEAGQMRRVAPFVGRLTPELFHFDPDQYVIVMEKLAPHVILRQGLIAGRHYPRAATDIADYVAAAAFFTSGLAQKFEASAGDRMLFSCNLALQRISVDLVFTDPYHVCDRNRITPALEPWARALREDVALKRAVARARALYLGKPQSVLHGDLHSGSIMVTSAETRVIDGEFAWVGPSGFDVGNFIAHLVMNWFAKPYHGGNTAVFRALLVIDIMQFWLRFEARFLHHWRGFTGESDLYPLSHFGDSVGQEQLETIRRDYVTDLFADAIRFAACKIIRRIVGFAQIADFLVIEDEQNRAHAQAGALALATSMLKQPGLFRNIADLAAALPQYDHAGLDPP